MILQKEIIEAFAEKTLDDVNNEIYDLVEYLKELLLYRQAREKFENKIEKEVSK